MNAYTQYLFGVSDTSVRRVKLLAYDGNKYVVVKDYETRRMTTVKTGYLFSDREMTRHRLTARLCRCLEDRERYFALIAEILHRKQGP